MIRRTLVLFTLAFTVTNLPAADRETVADQLGRAQSLAWAKRFEDAARIYLAVLQQLPASREATLGLGRVRLWQGRYGDARQLFRRLIDRNPGDADAVEGAATAAYWSGDFRTAEREFRALVAAHPERKTARQMLDELHSGAAATERIQIGVVDDDQPFRAMRSEARVSIFTDPLTRWDVSAGGYQLSSDEGGRHGAPFAMLQNETVLPSVRLTMTTALGAIRTPDQKTHTIGGASGRLRVRSNESLAISYWRREMLSNATRLYPFVDVASLRWEHSKPWLASIGLERDRFSDRNSANAADAYALVPVLKRGRWTFWSGASALRRDTRESRFYVSGITASRDVSGRFFRYTYRGAYNPYWTPQDLLEARLILAVEGRIGSGVTMRVQGDGGWARDHGVAFWPDAGLAPFPASIGQSSFNRTYQPWRLRVTSSAPLGRGISLDFAYEHSVTTFYRANTFHATVARRH